MKQLCCLQGSKVYLSLCFLGGSVVKNPSANAGDSGSIPGLGRSPGGGLGNPLQHPCLETPMDRGAWWATVHGVAESDTRKGLSLLAAPSPWLLMIWSAEQLPSGWAAKHTSLSTTHLSLSRFVGGLCYLCLHLHQQASQRTSLWFC